MQSSNEETLLKELYLPLAQELVSASNSVFELVNSPTGSRVELAKRVSEIENRADDLLIKLVKKIGQLNVNIEVKDQYLDLANYLDDAIDSLEEASDLTVLHNVGEFPQGTNDLVQAVKNLSELTLKNLKLFDDSTAIENYFTLANKIEDDGDRIHRRITALLFNGSYPAMDVLRIVGVVDLFEDSLDDMARVARAVNSLNLHK